MAKDIKEKNVKKLELGKYTLILMRHSKTEPSGRVIDFERELIPSGRRKAVDFGKKIKKYNIIPNWTLTSAAVRAVQTAKCVLASIDDESNTAKEVENIKLSKTLYMADADKLLERIQKSGEKHPEVKIMLVVAHDPTVSILGARLGNIEDSDNDSLMQVSAGFSTAMGAIFTSDKPFKKWDNKEEKLVKIIRGEE